MTVNGGIKTWNDRLEDGGSSWTISPSEISDFTITAGINIFGDQQTGWKDAVTNEIYSITGNTMTFTAPHLSVLPEFN